MVDRLKGKVAVVTGAGSRGPGVGNGKARRLKEPAAEDRLVTDERGLAGEDDEDCLGHVFGQMTVCRSAVRAS